MEYIKQKNIEYLCLISVICPREDTRLLKKKLTSNQIQEIRKDLTVKPFVNTDFGAQSQPFAVYGESARKLYIPRFMVSPNLATPTSKLTPLKK